MRRLVILAVLALAACHPAKAPPADPAPPAPARLSDFGQDMDLRGADPAWSLRIRGLRFTLSQPGQPDVVAQAPGGAMQPQKAVWEAKAGDEVMRVTLYASGCVDAASGRAYPMTAEVEFREQMFNGCAGKADARH
jgi:uncharacterized membrane protein